MTAATTTTTTTLSYSARWQARRKTLMDAGKWGTRYVDPGPARAHVNALRAAHGISYGSVAALAGLHTDSVEQMMMPGHHLYPTRIHRERERQVLAAHWDLALLDDTAWMTAVGVERRLRALAWMGWSQRMVADRYGVPQGGMPGRSRTARHTVGVVRRMDAVYRALCMTQGPSVRSHTIAVERGWAPPLAWDDDTIDNLYAYPQHGADTTARTRRLLRYIDAYRQGRTVDELAAEDGITAEAVARWCERQGRTGLAQALRATAARDENATGRKTA